MAGAAAFTEGPVSSTYSTRLERVASLYRAHFAFVWRVLRRCGVPQADLDDAVQDTFMVVYRRIDDFDGAVPVTTWLYAIATRVASTHRRSIRREHDRRDRVGASMHSSSVACPENDLTRREAADLLEELLDSLDDKKRTVFVLAELEGLSAPEIARIVGAKVNTVHSRLRLARAKFDDSLTRMKAREAGRLERARLLGQAQQHEPQPSESSKQATLAGLMVKIGGPSTAGAVSSTVSIFGWVTAPKLSWALSGALALGGAATWAVVGPSARASTPPPIVAQPSVALSQLEPLLATRPPSSHNEGSTQPVIAPVEPTVQPTRDVSVEPAVLAGRPQPSSKPHRRATPHRRAPASKPTKPREPLTAAETKPDDSLARELQLIENARRALRDQQPDIAVRFLDTHAQRFPAAVLDIEAKATRIAALCALGRQRDAQRIATTPRLRRVAQHRCDMAAADQ